MDQSRLRSDPDGEGPAPPDDEGPAPPDDERDETPLQRWDRNFAELLQELRVAQTGVQILFAFLLTLPFTNRFTSIGALHRNLYVVTLTASAVATALLIAPVSYHRLVFRQGQKPQLVRIASAFAVAGLAALLVAMLSAIFLVLAVVAGLPLAAVIGTALAVLYVALWYVLPVVARLRGATRDARRLSR